MRTLVLTVACLVAAVFLGSAAASAHIGGATYVVVASDFILPGQPFQVIVGDIGQDAPVDFRIVNEQRTEELGSTRAAPDGHLMTDLQLPSDFPVGYAQLYATVPDGLSTSTWVLVGERTSTTPPPPGITTAPAPWWTDPSVIVLGVLVIGAVAVFAYLLLRPKRVSPIPAAVGSGRTRRRTSKRSRR